MKFKEILRRYTPAGLAIGGVEDMRARQKQRAKQSAEDAAYNAAQGQSAQRQATQAGLAAGEQRASSIYGPSSDLASLLASSRKYQENQMMSGMGAPQYEALRGRNIASVSSAAKASNQALQSKLAGQGMRGGAAVKASAALGQKSSQDIIGNERDLAAMSAQMSQKGAENLAQMTQDAISASNKMRLAEGGLGLASETANQLAVAQAQPTSGNKFGMAICGTLLSYGLMSRDLHAKENIVVSQMNPKIVEAYNKTSPAVVNIMNQNEAVRPVIAKLTNAWANEITKEKPNLLGKIVNTLGQSFLKIVSKIS